MNAPNSPAHSWHVLIPLFLLVASPPTASAEDRIDETLTRIDSEQFMYYEVISFASGQEAVKDLLKNTSEIRYLTNHSRSAIPKMLLRLKRHHGIHFGPTRLAYFVVFENCNDPRVVSALADYLDSVPANEEQQAIESRFHPYEFALSAAWRFLNVTMPLLERKYASEHQLFQQRHQIATQLRLAYRK